MQLKYTLPYASTVPSTSAYADQPLEPDDVITVPDDFAHDPEGGSPFVETDEATTRTRTVAESEPEPEPEPDANPATQADATQVVTDPAADADPEAKPAEGASTEVAE